MEARLFNNATGTIVGTSPTFKFTSIPTNPSKSNISQGKFTAIEKVQVICAGQGSGFFNYWVTSKPSDAKIKWLK